MLLGLILFSSTLLAEPKACPPGTVPVAVYSGNASCTGTRPAERMKSLAESVIKSVRDAPEAKFYVLPELILTPHPGDKEDFDDVKSAAPYSYPAPPLNQIPTSEPFASLAKVAVERKAFIQVGFLEKGTGAEEGKLYNTALVVGPDGRVKAKHRKINLVKTKVANEGKYLTAGTQATTFDASAVGLGTAGVAICADTYDTGDTDGEEEKSLKEMNLAIEAYGKNPTPTARAKILALVEKIKALSLKAPAHLMEKYRAGNVDFLAVSAHWLEKADAEEGFTRGWTPKDFFQETAQYLNHGSRESSLSRYPAKLPEGFLPGITYQQRTDRDVYVAFANTTSLAPTVGIYGPGGRFLVQRKTKEEGWVVGCVPKVAPRADGMGNQPDHGMPPAKKQTEK